MAEGGATEFGSSLLGALQVSSSSHLYHCCNLNYICGSCPRSIPQISNCVSYSGHLVVLSRTLSGTSRLITHQLKITIPVLVLLRRRAPCSSISADAQVYQA